MASIEQPAEPQQHRAECCGVLRPDSVYTADGVMRAAGFGRESLGAARRSGIVRPIEIGRHVYYLGSELIAWIRTQGGPAKTGDA